ncbi:DUF551 domain-containing protein [Enterobacter hormaechei]|uniref:DUF551 domain-containing protein n=1 Tax=Enterobacter hormaechei TaxID=158836 RepID=UPI00125C025B|nr:DUF551 domain-containing protein [Enterobacter hormaechei]VAL16429.1 Protein of uncharacterised function (DUF551) [Enterobacter hormaechei]
MAEFTKQSIIEDLKASTQNASGMFEISEDTICALMSMLTSTAPQLPQPAVLSVSEGVLKSLLPDVEKSEFWFEHNGKIFFEGVRFNNAVFEACRAAMLQGAELVSNRDELPDGWVACSERMPEDEQEVIVQNKMGYRYVSYFDEHSGLFFDMRGGNQMNCIEHIFVTHWMPMPAAPQQEA